MAYVIVTTKPLVTTTTNLDQAYLLFLSQLDSGAGSLATANHKKMKKTSAHVPATRGLEVANIIARAEVKGLVTEARSEAFLEMLEGVDIDADTATSAHALSGTLQLAR